MSFSGLIIRGLISEIRPEICGSRIDKIYNYQNEYHFYLRNQRAKVVLILSVDAKYYRLQLTEEKPPISYPDKPNSFCMLLRRYLTGMPITEINQLELDRVLSFDFVSGYGEDLQPRRYQLICELMGRNSNLILIGPDQYILGAARLSSLEQNSYREVMPGAKYITPPRQLSKDLLSIDSSFFRRSILLAPPEESLEKVLLETVQGIDKWLARKILEQAGLRGDLKRSQLKDYQLTPLWEEVKSLQTSAIQNQWKPTLILNRQQEPVGYLPFAFDLPEHLQYSSFCQLLTDYYRPLYKDREQLLTIKDLGSALKQELKKTRKKIKAQEQDYASAKDAEELKKKADLLMAYLHQVTPGSSQVSLPDFEDGSLIEIELNPGKRPSENASDYYAKYAKAKRKRERSWQELAKSKAYLSYLEQLQEDLRQQETKEDLLAIQEELEKLGVLKEEKNKIPTKRRRDEGGPQYKTVELEDGSLIMIGRNSKQNDYITMKKANPEDLWFHVKKQPGSHVILRSSSGKPSEEAILTAARYAASYSKAFQSNKVEVDYTQRKNVWKPKGAKPGMVLYENYQTILVEPF